MSIRNKYLKRLRTVSAVARRLDVPTPQGFPHMVKRRICNALAPVLIGAVLIVAGAPEAAVSGGADPPVSAARRKPRVPSSSPVIPEDVDHIPPAAGAPPSVSIPPPVTPPPPPPTPPPTEAPPVVQSNVSPPPAPPPINPIRLPSKHLPTTGVAAAFAALAGAFLSVGGLCVAAGRGRRQVAASAQRTP